MWLLIPALLVSASTSTTARLPPIVQTFCGPVSGEVNVLPYSNETVAFFGGIPYALPPVGALRFRPPQPPACPWSGVLNGSAPKPPCVQPSGSGAEDCLYLSISVPLNHTLSDPPLPVLVYFHGGNLIGGSAPVGSLDVLAVRSNVIAVGVSYRLNMLGFLATADLAAEPGWVGNQGIADAIASLQWVKGNIASFGGDAARVTLMGQSSGGTLIFALFCAPSAVGLFAGAISLSGSPNITQSAAAKQAQDAPTQASLGCATQPTAGERVACLRALNASALAQATGGTSPSWGTPGIFGWSLPAGIPAPPVGQNYAGIVHVDGTLLTQPLHEALANQLVPASLVISNMEAEGGGGGFKPGFNATLDQWLAVLQQSFPPGTWGREAGPRAAGAVFEAYRAEAIVAGDLAYHSINSDFGLSCASQAIAQHCIERNASRSTPLYLLYNAWRKGNWSQGHQGNAERWPYHGLDFVEMGWAWGSEYTPLPSDFAAADVLQRLVGDYARGGGVLPPSWGWEPVGGGRPIQTLVVAQQDGWPGGGTRVQEAFKERQCAVLKAHFTQASASSLDLQQWWWCD
jgi:hypothetical protein